MNSGIFYLYEYKENQRLRNAGFLKLSSRRHSCEIQLRACGIPVSKQDTLTLSVLWQDNETIFSHSLAKIPCEAHSFSVHLTFPESNLPAEITLNQIAGFLILLPNGNVLAAVVSGIILDTKKIQEYKELERPVETEETQTDMSAEVTSAEIHLSEISENSDSDLSATLENFVSQNTELQPSETPRTNTTPEENQSPTPCRTIRKIQRSELSLLPRKCWHLSNNSFLLHGYYNYNHLLLVEENGHFWLGVPGIYDTREAGAAELFGFPQFNDSYNAQLELSEDECNSQGKFGYWFHYIY